MFLNKMIIQVTERSDVTCGMLLRSMMRTGQFNAHSSLFSLTSSNYPWILASNLHWFIRI